MANGKENERKKGRLAGRQASGMQPSGATEEVGRPAIEKSLSSGCGGCPPFYDSWKPISNAAVISVVAEPARRGGRCNGGGGDGSSLEKAIHK